MQRVFASRGAAFLRLFFRVNDLFAQPFPYKNSRCISHSTTPWTSKSSVFSASQLSSMLVPMRSTRDLLRGVSTSSDFLMKRRYFQLANQHQDEKVRAARSEDAKRSASIHCVTWLCVINLLPKFFFLISFSQDLFSGDRDGETCDAKSVCKQRGCFFETLLSCEPSFCTTFPL